jgi:hypothetical protein
MVTRRQVLKGLLWGSASVAALGVGAAADFAYQTDKYEKEIEASTCPVAEIFVRNSLRQIIAMPSLRKMIGADHADAEVALYAALADDFVIQGLKEKQITKVFSETNVVFAPLFKEALRKNTEDFVKTYLSMYPSEAEQEQNETPEQLARVKSIVAAKHKAASALAKAGMAFIPYDTRWKGDLAKALRTVNAKAALEQMVEQTMTREKGFMGLARQLCAFLVGGAEAQDKVGLAIAHKNDAALMARKDPMLLAYKRIITEMLANEADNLAEINKNLGAEEGALVIGGEAHVDDPRGLAALMRAEKPTTTAAMIDDRYAAGSITRRLADHDFYQTIPPDFFIGLKNGLLVSTTSPEGKPLRGAALRRESGKGSFRL